MKQNLILLFFAILMLSCSKNDDNLTSINYDGTGGISCKVNGKVLKPEGGGLYGNKSAKIDYLPDEQINYLILGFTNNHGRNSFKALTIFAYPVDRENLEGQVFQLKERETITSYGYYTSGEATSAAEPGEQYYTNSENEGELKILYYDREERIISGEFFFTAVNEFGEKIEITEGRFDMRL